MRAFVVRNLNDTDRVPYFSRRIALLWISFDFVVHHRKPKNWLVLQNFIYQFLNFREL